MSAYEQYISHLRTWTSKYHLSIAEIEVTPLVVLFDLEIVDSKIEAAFEDKRQKELRLGNRHAGGGRVFIDQIL